MERFCWLCLPSFSASAKMPHVQLRRSGDAGLPKAPHVLEALGLQASSSTESGGAPGCCGLLGLRQVWGIFFLLRCWWVQPDTGSTKAHDKSPFDVSPEVHWLTVRGNAESFPFLPPDDLHSAQATDTLTSLLNHAQHRHNHLQLWFTWILVVWKYLWHGWDSFLISTKEIKHISKHCYSDEIDFTVVNSCLLN